MQPNNRLNNWSTKYYFTLFQLGIQVQWFVFIIRQFQWSRCQMDSPFLLQSGHWLHFIPFRNPSDLHQILQHLKDGRKCCSLVLMKNDEEEPREEK